MDAEHERPQHLVDLALQGGGSHGAFTWGVLDRLLEDPRIAIGGLSGTSAGAMNAVVLVSGLARGGRAGARDALAGFWDEIAHVDLRGMTWPSPLDVILKPWLPGGRSVLGLFDVLSRLVSPYQLNPLNINPLRAMVERHVDFGAISSLQHPKIFLSATDVRTGRNRVFRNRELSVDAVLASAALPVIFHAVSLDDEYYWDGGYAANPALLPLIAESAPSDLVLVQLNPVERPQVPRTATAIIDRINEISFNSSLDQELRTVGLIKRLLDEEASSGHSYRAPLFARIDELRVHRIHADKALLSFGAASKLNRARGFIQRLHDLGHAAADEWLAHNAASLGVRSTVALGDDYLARTTGGGAEETDRT